MPLRQEPQINGHAVTDSTDNGLNCPGLGIHSII